MGEWTLDDVDEVLRTDGGRTVCGFIQRDARANDLWMSDEPLHTLALLLRLGRTMLRFPRTFRSTWPRGVLLCARTPPPFAIAIAAACGVAVLVGERDEARLETLRARSPDRPRMVALAARACAELAAGVAGDLGVELDLDGLARVERAFPLEDRESAPEAYWSSCLRMAAFTGEVLRRRIGGRWTMTPLVSASGLALRVGYESDANVLDKVMKLMANGPDEDSLVRFVRMVESLAAEVESGRQEP